jgi:tight adherence protein C
VSIIIGAFASVVAALVIARSRPRAERVLMFAARPGRCASARSDRRRSALTIVVRRIVPACVAAIVFGPLVGAAVFIATALWPRVHALRDQRRRLGEATLAYPDFVDLLVLSIKSGLAPAQALAALEGVVPAIVQPGITSVLQRTATGYRFAEAVVALHEPPPLGLGPIAQPLVDALALADRYGTPLTPILDRLAEEARAQRRRNAEAAARRLPIQLSFPLVGCTLPSFVLLTVVPLMAGTFSSLRGLTP